MVDHEPDLEGGPALRTIAMPGDTNPNGDIFGGWLLAQMDVAGGMVAARRAHGRVATVGIEAMKFHQPVLIGDEVSCYCTILRIGRTTAYRLVGEGDFPVPVLRVGKRYVVAVENLLALLGVASSEEEK